MSQDRGTQMTKSSSIPLTPQGTSHLIPCCMPLMGSRAFRGRYGNNLRASLHPGTRLPRVSGWTFSQGSSSKGPRGLCRCILNGFLQGNRQRRGLRGAGHLSMSPGLSLCNLKRFVPNYISLVLKWERSSHWSLRRVSVVPSWAYWAQITGSSQSGEAQGGAGSTNGSKDKVDVPWSSKRDFLECQIPRCFVYSIQLGWGDVSS